MRRDFNFFSPYLVKKKKGISLITVLQGILFLLLLLMVGYSGLLMSGLNEKKAEKAKIDSEINDPSYQALYQSSLNDSKEYEELYREEMFFKMLQGGMLEVHRVNEQFMKFLGKEVIKDMHLLDLSISNRDINLNGVALTRKAIAQFERDLRATGTFDDILIGAIVKQNEMDNFYRFSMRIRSKMGEHLVDLEKLRQEEEQKAMKEESNKNKEQLNKENKDGKSKQKDVKKGDKNEKTTNKQ